MLLPAVCTFWPWRVGLLVDHLEVATQLGDELLAGHRTRAAPEVTGSQHIANDGLVLGSKEAAWERIIAPWASTSPNW